MVAMKASQGDGIYPKTKKNWSESSFGRVSWADLGVGTEDGKAGVGLLEEQPKL